MVSPFVNTEAMRFKENGIFQIDINCYSRMFHCVRNRDNCNNHSAGLKTNWNRFLSGCTSTYVMKLHGLMQINGEYTLCQTQTPLMHTLHTPPSINRPTHRNSSIADEILWTTGTITSIKQLTVPPMQLCYSGLR